MIKQYVLTIEASDEAVIDTFVDLLNKQTKALEGHSPLKIHVERSGVDG
jgi:hypothetical protein